MDIVPAKAPAILGWSERKLAVRAAFAGGATGIGFSFLSRSMAPAASMLAPMFALRGPQGLVSISIAVMFFWGAAVCWLRWRRQRCLERVASRALLLEATRRLAAGGPEALTAYIEKLNYASPLLHRLTDVLRQWQLRPGLVEADLVLQQHQVRDDESVRRGYQLTRIFVWAMPVVGLMGTVIGISLAVGGFAHLLSGNVDEVGAIKQSLVEVTKGLSFAFMVTLEGLLGALLVMLPAASLQGREEGFLVTIQHAIASTFLPELQRVAPALAGHPDRPVLNLDDLEATIRRALSGTELAQSWQRELQRLSETVAAHLAQATEAAGGSAIRALARASEQAGAGLLSMVERQEQMATHLSADLEALRGQLDNLLDGVAHRLGEAAGEVGQQLSSLRRAETACLAELVRSLEQQSLELRTSLAGHQEAFRETVQTWQDQGPRVDSYFVALQQLGASVERAVSMQQAMQDQMTALNVQGTLPHALDSIQRTLAELAPFLRKLTGTFHFVTMADSRSPAMLGSDQ